MMFPSPQLLVLVTLPTMAIAFVHIHSHHITMLQDTHRDSVITMMGAHDDMMDSDSKCTIRSQINEVLIDTKSRLLSDITRLLKEQPHSTIAADNDLLRMKNITLDQKVHQVLLSSRLHLPFLNRTTVGTSTIDGAGRGLFATESILSGEVITCYPGDAILYEIPLLSDEIEEENEETEAIVLWGTHVSTKDRWDDDVVFDGSDASPSLVSYAVSVDDEYSVLGHPELEINSAYAGHYANDGAGHLALEKPNSQNNIIASLELGLDTEGMNDDDDDDDGEIGVEENIAAYVLTSIEIANAMHRSVDEEGSHIVTVATRDIQAGDEIFVTYGPDYWLGYAQ